MATKIGTIQNPEKTEALLPRTCLKAIADKNGDYISEDVLASDINALEGGAISSLNNKNIIRIKDVNIGDVSVQGTGYVDISSYRPSFNGYSLLSCAIKDYGNFASGTPAGFFVDANGRYLTAPAYSTIANITVRYIFVKTENLYDN